MLLKLPNLAAIQINSADQVGSNEVGCSKRFGIFKVEVNRIVITIPSSGERFYEWCRSCCFGTRGCPICIQYAANGFCSIPTQLVLHEF
jgi:hypothetical protein